MRSPGQSINTVRLLIHIDTSWGGTFAPIGVLPELDIIFFLALGRCSRPSWWGVLGPLVLCVPLTVPCKQPAAPPVSEASKAGAAFVQECGCMRVGLSLSHRLF